MKNILYTTFSIMSLLIFGGCIDSEDELKSELLAGNSPGESLQLSSGTADFSTYVALGNSSTAGFSDGALYPQGQTHSYPSMLASQFTLAGGGSFNFPDISSGNGFGGLNSDNSIRGKSFIDIASALTNPANAIQFTSGSALNPSSQSSINNFGVPGARIIDAVTPGYGNFNPFYGAFQSSATGSMLGDAVAAGGTFFSVWLGSNDVLRFAIAGGEETDDDSTEGNQENLLNPDLLTPVSSFSDALSGILDALSANGANGIIVNIPPVTILPYFQIVTQLSGGVNLIPLDAPTASVVNDGYSDYNDGLDAAVFFGEITQEEADRRKIMFSAGANPPVITDESLTKADVSLAFGAPPGSVILPKLRHAEATDLFPLPALTVIGQLADPGDPTSVYGVGVPVPDKHTLTLAEQAAIITRYATFNAIIAQQAAARSNVSMMDVGVQFADIFGLSAQQAALLGLSADAQAAADGVPGTMVDGYNMVALSLGDDLFNSLWSSDGIHMNPRGSALIANQMIRIINEAHGSELREVDVLNFAALNAKLP